MWLLQFNGNASLKCGIKEAFVNDLLFPSLTYLPLRVLRPHIKHIPKPLKGFLFFFSSAKLRLTRLDIPEMFKWGKTEKQHFFKPTLCIRDKQKLAQGQKNPPPKKKFKSICEIISNTPNVPDRKALSCTADPSPHIEYCTFLERAVGQGDRIDKPAHRTASLSPSTPRGQCHHPQQHSGSVGGWQGPACPSKQVGSPKKTPNLTSPGLGNELGVWKPG